MLSRSDDAVILNSTSLDLTMLSISADYLSQSHLNTQQLSIMLVKEADEGKATRPARITLLGQVDVANISKPLKQRLQVLHDGTVGQVIHPETGHPIHITWWPSE